VLHLGGEVIRLPPGIWDTLWSIKCCRHARILFFGDRVKSAILAKIGRAASNLLQFWGIATNCLQLFHFLHGQKVARAFKLNGARGSFHFWKKVEKLLAALPIFKEN